MQALNINSSRKPNQRSEEEKKTLITQWEHSHQTIPTFYKEQGIVPSQFYYWLKKHRNIQTSNQPIKTNNNFIGLALYAYQWPRYTNNKK
jgi:transposase-like protein